MDLARDHGATRIDLNTSVTDDAARALYEKCGFTNESSGRAGRRCSTTSAICRRMLNDLGLYCAAYAVPVSGRPGSGSRPTTW